MGIGEEEEVYFQHEAWRAYEALAFVIMLCVGALIFGQFRSYKAPKYYCVSESGMTFPADAHHGLPACSNNRRLVSLTFYEGEK